MSDLSGLNTTLLFLILLIQIFILFVGFGRGVKALITKIKVKLTRFAYKATSISEYEAFIFQLSYSLKNFSRDKIGALIVIERKDDLNRYVNLGYSVRTSVTSEFLNAVFSNKKSALHDGGVIIRGFDIVSVSSYFPVTQGKMVVALGARHRAAAGLTEKTDAVAIIVSETTGKVSYSSEGKIQEIAYEGFDSLASELFGLLNFYID